MQCGFVALPYDEKLYISPHENWPGVPEPSCLGPWTGHQEPRHYRTIERAPTFPPSVLPEQLALDGFARAVVRGPTAGGYGAQSLQLSRRVQDHGPRIMGHVLWRLAL